MQKVYYNEEFKLEIFLTKTSKLSEVYLVYIDSKLRFTTPKKEELTGYLEEVFSENNSLSSTHKSNI